MTDEGFTLQELRELAKTDPFVRQLIKGYDRSVSDILSGRGKWARIEDLSVRET